MRPFEHEVLFGIDKRALLLGVTAPQDEDEAGALAVQYIDDRVGELLPPFVLMTPRLGRLHRKRRVQQQHTLLGPTLQMAMVRRFNSQILLQFLKNILQRRRNIHARLHRKTQTVRLLSAMVRVLTENHHFHFIERRMIERRKELRCFGIDDLFLSHLAGQELAQIAHIVFPKLGFQMGFPAGLELHAVERRSFRCDLCLHNFVEVSYEQLQRARIGIVQTALPQNFYARDTIDVARELLGQRIVHQLPGGRRVAGRIVETEAYLGVEDPAAHSFGGKITPRTKVLFGEPGRSYIYLIYGMYWCLNVVTMARGTPEAVLIRALEPIEGLDVMREARRHSSDLARGPGKLCQALRLERRHNDRDLTTGRNLWIEPDLNIAENKILVGPRIGIDYAGDAVHWPLRFGWAHHPDLSRPFPAP